MKTLDYRFRQKLQEVYAVQPNNLGNPMLTSMYHGTTKFFKNVPFIFIIPLSFLVTLGLYFLFGSLVVKLVSTLQYGF